MSDHHNRSHDLVAIARDAMLARGLEADFTAEALRELEGINAERLSQASDLTDMSQRLWCSIDNDDSLDLDQITVAERLAHGQVRIFVGIADVDARVKQGGPIDLHAQKNTTSVYTGIKIFPMLPEKLSNDLTSLAEQQPRIAVIIEMDIGPSGAIEGSRIYRARVKNQAKLTYNAVAAWLDGTAELPEAALRVPGMDEQLRVQDEVAQKMRGLRYREGALELETIEPRAVIEDGVVIDLKHEKKNRATELIEDFMIAANGVTARYLNQAGSSTLRRVVRAPNRCERIVQIAEDLGDTLPGEPDSKALSEFLSRRKVVDPLRFPDLSLSIVKLLGRGEYVLEKAGQAPLGHFGLAVRDYSHATAPNRRFPDLITQRLVKAVLSQAAAPYTDKELGFLAVHCTAQEDAADKVERQVRKSTAALLLEPRIGEIFEGIVTGSSEKGTWARVLAPPVEGKIIRGQNNLDVGDRVRLKLLNVSVERGFIDFVRVER